MSYNTLPADESDSAYQQWLAAQVDDLVLDFAPDTFVARTSGGERVKFRNPTDYVVAACVEVEADLATP
jgi:hypothetical protein